jgi:hypothetical protein
MDPNPEYCDSSEIAALASTPYIVRTFDGKSNALSPLRLDTIAFNSKKVLSFIVGFYLNNQINYDNVAEDCMKGLYVSSLQVKYKAYDFTFKLKAYKMLSIKGLIKNINFSAWLQPGIQISLRRNPAMWHIPFIFLFFSSSQAERFLYSNDI